jgi:polar amino acid transport system ATP-binding protein
MAILEVKNIHKSFGKEEVLRGINFELDKGEVLAIIGSSGSGKTTLLRCLNFLEIPQCGQIVVDGKVLFDAEIHGDHRQSESEIRRNRLHFGLVFQSFNLFPQYNVLKNITLASQLLAGESLKKDKQVMDKSVFREHKKQLNGEIEQNALRLLERVGLSSKRGAYPFELSGGQQQRVAIARALALNPDILCFDEPTSALDPELSGEVLRVIKGLKSSESTMIVVTHEMEFARNIADKVIFMADGIIEEEGTPQQVFNNPRSEKTRAFIAHAYETI